MSECLLTLGGSEEQSLRASVTITVLMETATLLSDSKVREEEEINRLETALLVAKEKNKNTIAKKVALDIDISAAVKAVEVSGVCVSLNSYFSFDPEIYLPSSYTRGVPATLSVNMSI